MASAPSVRGGTWTPPPPARPAFPPSAPPHSAPPPSAPPPSAQPPPPLPFHLWRRRQQRRVRSAFSAASGARKQWDAASADGLRAATAVVNRLVQLKQLPSKDMGALTSMGGIVLRAAEKLKRLMAAAVEALGSALLPVCPPPQMPPPLHAPDATVVSPAEPDSTVMPFTFGTSLATLAATPPAATAAVTAAAAAAAAAPAISSSPSQFRTASAASVSPSPSAAVWDADKAWEEAWQERDMYPKEPIFTALHLSVFEGWAVDVADMFHRELLVKRLIVSSLTAAVTLEATTARATATTIAPSTTAPITTSHSPLRLPLNIPPLCLPFIGQPPTTVTAPRVAAAECLAAAALDASAVATEQGASTGGRTEAGGGRLGAAGEVIAGAGGDAATSRHEDSRETPAAREEAAEGEAAGCLQGEGMGTSSGDTEAMVGGESDEGRVQGGAAMEQGQNGWKGQAWAHGFGAAGGGEWVVVQQQLEQSGLLARSPTPQQLQVCLVAWLVEMHIDSRHLSFIFAAVDEEVKSAAA
ncbi:unnamed protein product [Closterium sp. Naga37s-1]|nr:unnamed protein product [Closterium sp. Naga37s-1]